MERFNTRKSPLFDPILKGVEQRLAGDTQATRNRQRFQPERDALKKAQDHLAKAMQALEGTEYGRQYLAQLETIQTAMRADMAAFTAQAKTGRDNQNVCINEAVYGLALAWYHGTGEKPRFTRTTMINVTSGDPQGFYAFMDTWFDEHVTGVSHNAFAAIVERVLATVEYPQQQPEWLGILTMRHSAPWHAEAPDSE